MKRYICIHGHFYQPPRENPWLEEIEIQDSAHPYHDWNERITEECYAPNTASRILDHERKIIDMVNNFSKISFNFGPSLLSWLARHRPYVYHAILEADKKSQERFSGHGSALAQCYNHMIMPHANSQDKKTQIIWGIQDFVSRFKRNPEGMWLPETAVDKETLDLMALYGIKFVILAPRQAKAIRHLGEKKWTDVHESKINGRMPYTIGLPSGRTIAAFFYDGPIAQDIAFGGLLRNGEYFADRLFSAFVEDGSSEQLVHVATDGETYGHHHRHGDMALAYCLHRIESHKHAAITIYGEYLELYPPTYEADIFENSSWSCIHGIDRWSKDCGCHAGMHHGWTQKWRAPLREAMNWLRDELAKIFVQRLTGIVKDPWQLRNDYIQVILDRSLKNTEHFLKTHIPGHISRAHKVQILKLLEMQRHGMLMFTSCGWFFDEISGIETMQIIQYAARAMQLAYEITEVSLEAHYLKLLEKASSNIPEMQNGARMYQLHIQPNILNFLRIGVHYGISSLFKTYPKEATLYAFKVVADHYERIVAGQYTLALGSVEVHSLITQEEELVYFAMLHLGDHNIMGGAIGIMDQNAFVAMQHDIKESFTRSALTELIYALDTHFHTHHFSLWHLFRDQQREIIRSIFNTPCKEIENTFHHIYEHYFSIMQAAEWLHFPLPRYFSIVLEFVLNTDTRKLLEGEEVNFADFSTLILQAKKWGITLDKASLSYLANQKINMLMEHLGQMTHDPDRIQKSIHFLKGIEPFGLNLDLWQAQNICFSMNKKNLPLMKENAARKDPVALRWLEQFKLLGDYLKVKVE